jgi:hypothetical protein
MPEFERSVATLRLAGDDLDPDEVTRILGRSPTHAQSKGQEFPSKGPAGMRVAKFGQWRLHAADREPEDLNAQVEELLASLTTNVAAWRQLSERYAVDLFCGWFMKTSNDGVNISPKTMQALSERGIELALDIYAPCDDE